MDNFKAFGIDVGKGKHKEEMVYGVALVWSMIDKAVSVYLNKFNLSIAKFNVLMVIKHAGGSEGISQIEIGNRLIVTASNMTRLLDKLGKEGLITRGAQEGDRRVNIVKATKKASDLLDKIWPGYLKTIESLAEKLDSQDQKSLSGLLIKWFERLKG